MFKPQLFKLWLRSEVKFPPFKSCLSLACSSSWQLDEKSLLARRSHRRVKRCRPHGNSVFCASRVHSFCFEGRECFFQTDLRRKEDLPLTCECTLGWCTLPGLVKHAHTGFSACCLNTCSGCCPSWQQKGL